MNLVPLNEVLLNTSSGRYNYLVHNDTPDNSKLALVDTEWRRDTEAMQAALLSAVSSISSDHLVDYGTVEHFLYEGKEIFRSQYPPSQTEIENLRKMMMGLLPSQTVYLYYVPPGM